MTVRVAVIYYSATGNVHHLATEIAAGAQEAGAKVRLRKVAELADDSQIRANERWLDNTREMAAIPEATLDDLDWADAYLFGTPTRFGNVSAELKRFLDSTGALWEQGKLANKAASGFTSAYNVHGGQESTLLSLYQVLMHWGTIIVPPGYTDDAIYAAGGNPYGVSGTHGDIDSAVAAARYQGRRVTELAATLTHRRDLSVAEAYR